MIKIKNIIKNNKWILDIDEDYLGTNNPHAVNSKVCLEVKIIIY